MTANLAAINKYAAGARVYVFNDTPADGALMTHTAGVPAGYGTRELGATIGAATFEYKPTVALTDIEQYFGQVAPRLTAGKRDAQGHPRRGERRQRGAGLPAGAGRQHPRRL
jgi:hypothetical protein